MTTKPNAFNPADMAGFSQAFASAFTDMSSEVMGFLARRFEHDLETQRKLVSCRSLPELQHIQMEHLQTAIDQYAEEVAKLMALGQTAMADPAEHHDRTCV